MYEDAEFARSLRPTGTQDVGRESRLFTAEDSEMMNMIFQYLEVDDAAKEVAAMETKKWEAPRLDFDPALVADFQRFAEYNGSSQESSPSPTVSLFSESSSYKASGVSGLTTPRSLSNRSSRSPGGMERIEKPDELRMTTRPTEHLLISKKPARLTPPPPSPWIPENRRSQDEVRSPQQLPSPVVSVAASTIRRHELKDPQDKRQNSDGDLHWPSMATIASKYERKGSRQHPYRHLAQPSMPPPMASGARRDELEEASHVAQPSYQHGSSRSLPLNSSARAQSQRSSQEVSPSPRQTIYSPENSSARTYESRSSQNTFQTHRKPLPALSESGSNNTEQPYSPATAQRLNRPQPPPVDPSLRRYESFKISGANAGRYELKDPQETFPVNETTSKHLDNLIGSKPSIRSRFSFPKPIRANITSFVDILPYAPPSPAITPPGDIIPLPTQLRIPTPDFSLPPRPKKELPAEPLPPLLSVGRKDASNDVPTSVLDVGVSRTSSGRSTRSRLSAPSLTIQIPASNRPPPQKVEDCPGLSEALDKFKQESILARSRPTPRRIGHELHDRLALPAWEPPVVTTSHTKIAHTSDSVLARPRPRPQTRQEIEFNGIPNYRASAPAPIRPVLANSVNANPQPAQDAPPVPYKPTPVPSESKPRPKRITFDETATSPRSPRGFSLEAAAPMIPAPNFSRTAHSYSFSEPDPHQLQFAAAHFEHQTPIAPRPLSLPRDFEREAQALKQKQKRLSQTLSDKFQTEYLAPSTGLQLTMSRRVATFSKLEWAVSSSDPSRTIRAFTQTNTLSRRTDFFDAQGEALFAFQRKTGSTRIGELGDGTGLFSVKNSSFGMSPYWVVNTTERDDDEIYRWVARGNESLTRVDVVWDGREVGRISCALECGKHTYTVDVSSEMNYAIMAALVTVFDDWRMDHAC